MHKPLSTDCHAFAHRYVMPRVREIPARQLHEAQVARVLASLARRPDTPSS